MRIALCTLVSMVALGACSAPGGPYPSLQPRAAERIDPRVPIERPLNDRPVTPALAEKLAALIAQARSGDAAFGPIAEQAERLAAAAGAPQSDAWVAAQQALSAAAAARAPTTGALGDIDALGANALQVQQGLSPADLEAIQSAGSLVGAIDQRQAQTIKTVQARLER
jgi:hypothetical protein